MSELKIYAEHFPEKPEQHFTDYPQIVAALIQAGVRFEHWQASESVGAGDSQEKIIAAYRKDIDRLIAEEGFQTVDVISLQQDNPAKEAIRQKFLSEHIHTEDEVRMFVDGCGLFYLHIGQHVFSVLCEKGDLISVPANTRHWFDTGPNPTLAAIRFFNNPDGWVAQYSGNTIADNFATLVN